jgi:hypothetical protein
MLADMLALLLLLLLSCLLLAFSLHRQEEWLL